MLWLRNGVEDRCEVLRDMKDVPPSLLGRCLSPWRFFGTPLDVGHLQENTPVLKGSGFS